MVNRLDLHEHYPMQCNDFWNFGCSCGNKGVLTSLHVNTTGVATIMLETSGNVTVIKERNNK